MLSRTWTYQREPRVLSPEELTRLATQQRATPFKMTQLERDAAKNWDKFYLRNADRFYKDRHWITREFDLLDPSVPV